MAELTEYRDGKLAKVFRTRDGKWTTPTSRTQQQARGVSWVIQTAFLPEGYPESVSSDFSGVIQWHTVQAMSSYVRGILASHAVFLGLGVGSQAASALSAVFQFFVRDLVGMLGGIAFASLAGGNFDSNAKQWRLFADISNNVGLALDLASPLVPGAFLLMASLGSIARAMVGMASGATHAALTQHFARANNAAEVSAKADARERACNIIGSLLGMGLTHLLADQVAAAWFIFLVLTWVHVWANVKALRCMVLTSLNEPRLQLLLHHYLDKEKVLTPVQVSALESLLIPPARRLLQCLTTRPAPYTIQFGAALSEVVTSYQQAHKLEAQGEAGGWAWTGSTGAKSAGRNSSSGSSSTLAGLLASQHDPAKFLLWCNPQKQRVIKLVLHHKAGPSDQLRAYLLAHLTCLYLQQAPDLRKETFASLCGHCGRQLDSMYGPFLEALSRSGWSATQVYLPRPTWTAIW